MIRRFGFVVVLVSALIVAACGRQVTPDKGTGTGGGSGLPAGFMQVKFKVAQQFNFNQYSYVIVFNTSGDGNTPRANGTQTAYRGYNFAIIVSGSGANATATAWYFFRQDNNPNTAPILFQVFPVGGQLQFNANDNGQGTEFTILFDRTLASAYQTPSPSPSASSSTTPSASPSPTSSASGSPSPNPSPTSTTGTVAGNWQFNYFVVQGQLQQGSSVGGPGTIVDSLGQGGGTDATYTSPVLNVLTSFDTGTFYPNPHVGGPPSDAAAQITSGDIQNNP